MQRQRTRRRLLDVALSLYASEGYEATSVDDICKRAALSKGAFYFHFAGKEALLAEALEELRECGDVDADLVRRDSDGQARPPPAREGSHSRDAHLTAALQLQLWAQALRQEEVRHHLRQRRERIAFALRRRPAQAFEGRGNVETLTRGLVALHDGLVSQSLLFPHDPVLERLDAVIASLTRDALAGPVVEPSGSARIERRSA